MTWIPFVTYASMTVCVLAVVTRVVKYRALPVHLRWELYPVAHEKGRARYGGSYLEEPEWWTKPRKVSLLGELKVMLPEIFLLAGVREHNKKHWYRSFPFHFGLYLLVALVILLAGGAIAAWAGLRVEADGGPIGSAIYHLTYVVGWTGLILGLTGAVALLALRALSADYREYTKPIDYFNLALFVITFSVAIAAHGSTDSDFTQLRAYVERLMLLKLTFDYSPLQGAEILLAGLLAAYIPLTHMSHFFTKWFMYHDIRWNDEPLYRGGKLERKVENALRYPVGWAAPHIRGNGEKNWLDVATSGVEEER